MTGPESSLDSLDAVYFSQQVPASAEALTLLAFIFDRIYFPGVYMPDVELDEEAVLQEIHRVAACGVRSIEDRQMLECMNFALHVRHVKDFCVFTGEPGTAGILEPGSEDLTMQLEELVFGPPPPDFFPSPKMGFNKGVAGKTPYDFRAQVNAPAW